MRSLPTLLLALLLAVAANYPALAMQRTISRDYGPEPWQSQTIRLLASTTRISGFNQVCRAAGSPAQCDNVSAAIEDAQRLLCSQPQLLEAAARGDPVECGVALVVPQTCPRRMRIARLLGLGASTGLDTRGSALDALAILTARHLPMSDPAVQVAVAQLHEFISQSGSPDTQSDDDSGATPATAWRELLGNVHGALLSLDDSPASSAADWRLLRELLYTFLVQVPANFAASFSHALVVFKVLVFTDLYHVLQG